MDIVAEAEQILDTYARMRRLIIMTDRIHCSPYISSFEGTKPAAT